MHATVIDTLRYANRLKNAGVEANQAEAMALAINDELTSGLATKADLDQASTSMKADLDRMSTAMKADLDRMSTAMKADLDRVSTALKGDLDRAVVALKGEIAKEIARVDGKIDAVDSKIEGQGRYIFLVLALIAALGLYNAAAPHLSQSNPRASSGGTAPPEMSATPSADVNNEADRRLAL